MDFFWRKIQHRFSTWKTEIRSNIIVKYDDNTRSKRFYTTLSDINLMSIKRRKNLYIGWYLGYKVNNPYSIYSNWLNRQLTDFGFQPMSVNWLRLADLHFPLLLWCHQNNCIIEGNSHLNSVRSNFWKSEVAGDWNFLL